MAASTAIDQSIITGVLLELFGDAGFDMPLERAPDVAGVPGTYVALLTIPAGTPQYFDAQPSTGGDWWYRIAASATGYTTSAFAPAVKATPQNYFASQVPPVAAVLSEIPRSFADPTVGSVIVQNLSNSGNIQPTTMMVEGGLTPVAKSLRPELVPNGEFDTWLTAALPYGWTEVVPGGVTIAKDTTTRFSGPASVKFSNPDNATNAGYHGLKTGFAVALRPGRRYRIHLAGRCSRVGAGQFYHLSVAFDVGATLFASQAFPFAAANTWQLDEWVLVVPAGADALTNIYLYVSRNGDPNATDFWVDAVRIEEEGASVTTMNDAGQVDLAKTGVVGKIATNISFTNPITASMLSHVGLSGFNAALITNGAVQDNGWHTDSATPGAVLVVDTGGTIANRYVACRVFATSAGYAGLYDIEYSDNGSSWTAAYGGFAPKYLGWNIAVWADAGGHRYWRLRLTNTPGSGPWLGELEFGVEQTGSVTVQDLKPSPADVVAARALKSLTSTPRVIVDLEGDRQVVSGDLYIESSKAPIVGTIASPGSKTKIIMIPGAQFIGRDPGTPWHIFTSGITIDGATGTERIHWCPFVLPPGVTLTEVAFRSYRDFSAEESLLRLYRIESDSGTVLATIDDTNTPVSTARTLTASLSEVTSTARTYMLEWDAKTENAGNSPWLGFVRITYTMPRYDVTV